MGMLAAYQEIKKEDFKTLSESDDFFETLEDLEEKDGTELCNIDKMWDALHFLINGLSAIYGAPEDNILSEFIIGSESFDEEAEEFARYIPTEKVVEIAKKLNEINFQDYLKDFDMNKFAEREEIMDELSISFENLRKFYNKVAENKNIVVVTIC